MAVEVFKTLCICGDNRTYREAQERYNGTAVKVWPAWRRMQANWRAREIIFYNVSFLHPIRQQALDWFADDVERRELDVWSPWFIAENTARDHGRIVYVDGKGRTIPCPQ